MKGKKTGGRTPGVPNKITADVKAIARDYTAEALDTLAGIMRDLEAPPQARVAAAKELLDRGHGKPAQTHEVTGAGGGPIQTTTVIHEHHGKS